MVPGPLVSAGSILKVGVVILEGSGSSSFTAASQPSSVAAWSITSIMSWPVFLAISAASSSLDSLGGLSFLPSLLHSLIMANLKSFLVLFDSVPMKEYLASLVLGPLPVRMKRILSIISAVRDSANQ